MTERDSNQSFPLPNLCDSQSLIFLIIICQLLVCVLMFFEYGLQFDWESFSFLTVYVQWQAMTSAVILCRLHKIFTHIQMPTTRGFAIAYAVLLVFSSVYAYSVLWFYQMGQPKVIDWDFIISNTMMSAIVLGVGLRYLFLHQQLVNREKAELQATLSALQARIKPHFLFNTMNSIASLIIVNPEKAEQMIEDLAALFRASFRDDVIETTLQDEWDLCCRYLDIEKLRLEERLQWTSDFSGVDMTLPIPSLCLQPLIENAVYHGVQLDPKGGFIRVNGQSNDKRVTIIIENSFSQLEDAHYKKSGNQMALRNIKNRIKHLYGDSAALELSSHNGVYTVILNYDVKKEERC